MSDIPSAESREQVRLNPQSAVHADDELLNSPPELQTFCKTVWETEYRECCENTRHAERLRNTIMHFWATFCGILFVAIGACFGQLGTHAAVSLTFVTVIGLVGCTVSALVLEMEKREMDYFAQWCQRCRVLEARMGFYGQYWRTYIKLVVPPEKTSRVTIMRVTYWFGIVFWAALFIAGVVVVALLASGRISL